jgi:membrane protein implicated in regulation of membrane protease activity
MDWWMWIAGGLALMVLELATPSGFFIMFFGLGALTIGTLTAVGVIATGWVQWLLFTAVSLVYLLLFREQIQTRFQAPPPLDVDSVVGVLAVPQETIEPGAVGKVEVRGSSWSARNVGAVSITIGQRCVVVAIDGLLLGVRSE